MVVHVRNENDSAPILPNTSPQHGNQSLGVDRPVGDYRRHYCGENVGQHGFIAQTLDEKFSGLGRHIQVDGSGKGTLIVLYGLKPIANLRVSFGGVFSELPRSERM
jgi:hypothetical protein